MPELLLEEQRENWGSRRGFVLAAIGSAVGLGNLWGFPYKVYSHGGGAFLIPYVIAMATIGIPLLILEFSLGHMTQRAAPDAFRGVNRRTEPIGWWGIILSFVIITYYAVILAWCVNYLVVCVGGIFKGGELPWAGQGLEGVNKAGKYFMSDYLNVWSADEIARGTKPWSLGSLAQPIVISLASVWVLMFLCIFRGVKAVSKVVLLTVPLPWIMLLILTIRGLTLQGAQEGLRFYLEPNWSKLAEPETWRWAFGQMFFSMSLAFGVMITYASFLHRKCDINNNAVIVGLADMGTSFIAGIAVFATLGGMAFVSRANGLDVPVDKVASEGPGLAFVAFPYALAQLPGSAWFGVVFFIALITLGIDSAFSITESVLASLVDKARWNRTVTLVVMSVVGFVIGLVYCSRGGLKWVGGIDDFINSTWGGIALLGLLECVVLGWGYRISRLREHANERSDWKIGIWWDWIIRYFAPILLSMLFIWSLLDKVTSTGGFLRLENGDLNVPVLVGLILAVIAPVLSIVLSLIRSPGADVHNIHKGLVHSGRAFGVIVLLLVVIALAGVVCGFDMERRAKLAEATGKLDALYNLDTAGIRPHAIMILAGGTVIALLATIIGSRAVKVAEKREMRPSGFVKTGTGLAIMMLGGAMGVLGAILLAMYKKPAETAPAAAPSQAVELSWISYVVLAVMLTLILVGLGWCFYRAIKAKGKVEPEPQNTEGLSED